MMFITDIYILTLSFIMSQVQLKVFYSTKEWDTYTLLINDKLCSVLHDDVGTINNDSTFVLILSTKTRRENVSRQLFSLTKTKWKLDKDLPWWLKLRLNVLQFCRQRKTILKSYGGTSDQV